MRRVLYISGSRADYGPARSVLRAIRDASDLDLSILVTGMHLDPQHGETWREIVADGFEIADRVPGRLSGDSPAIMAASMGLYLHGMSLSMARLQPDIVLVLGDRSEQLAGAMAAAFQNIVVVHLCGGTLSGSIDDSIRHAITKFAHYHLPGFEEAAKRIIQMGEPPNTVHVIGLPGGDIRPDVKFSREDICAEYHLPFDQKYLLVIQHSVTHAQEEAKVQIKETLEALAGMKYPSLLANPNDDAGGRSILAMMQEYAARSQHLHILSPPRSREKFASIMAHAGALIGNSSSAVVEAMSVGLPVVNIGERQQGREHLACWKNTPHQRDEIKRSIDQALHDKSYHLKLSEISQTISKQHASQQEQVVRLLKSLNLACANHHKPFYENLTSLSQ